MIRIKILFILAKFQKTSIPTDRQPKISPQNISRVVSQFPIFCLFEYLYSTIASSSASSSAAAASRATCEVDDDGDDG